MPQQYRYYTARATTEIIKIGAGKLKNTTTTATDISGSFNRVVSKKNNAANATSVTTAAIKTTIVEEEGMKKPSAQNLYTVKKG